MSISAFEFRAYELGSFRVLFTILRTDMTAKVGITYIDGDQYIAHDDVSARDAMTLRNSLVRQGYTQTEVNP